MFSLSLEVNGLYVLLSDRGDTFSFHWALCLAASAESRRIYHLINPAGSQSWIYECKSSTLPSSSSSPSTSTSSPSSSAAVADPRRLVVAVQIAVVEPALHEALGECLASLPISLYSTRFHEQTTCRVWVKEALYALDDQGYIALSAPVGNVERRALSLAVSARSLKSNSPTPRYTYIYSF